MQPIAWTTTKLSEAFGELNNITANFLSTQGVLRPSPVIQAAAVALGFIGIGVYAAPRLSRWIYSLIKPPFKPRTRTRTGERTSWQEILNQKMKAGERRLTQGILIPPTPSDSPEMHKNYQIGIELLNYSNEAILFSPNYLHRSETFRDRCNDPQAAKALRMATRNIHLKVSEQVGKEVGDHLQYTFKEIEIIGKYAVKYNVANCEGMCCACMVYARDKNTKQRIEMFLIRNHVFLLIGRNPSRPFSITNLERDAIVCDPWTQSCYPGNELTKHMVDLSWVFDLPEGEQYTIVKPLSSTPLLVGELDLADPSYSETSRPRLRFPISSSREPSEIDHQDCEGEGFNFDALIKELGDRRNEVREAYLAANGDEG